jgi:hypothetical protein
VKNDLCFICRKNRAGNPQYISFSHRGLSVKIFKDGLTCADCAKKRWIKDFEENAKEFVYVVDGKPKVNWFRYRERFDRGDFPNQEEKLHLILINIGILSGTAKGNWDLVAQGHICLNPKAFYDCLYFTREEDVVEFARLEYSYAEYYWEIHHIDKVILQRRGVIKKA